MGVREGARSRHRYREGNQPPSFSMRSVRSFQLRRSARTSSSGSSRPSELQIPAAACTACACLSWSSFSSTAAEMNWLRWRVGTTRRNSATSESLRDTFMRVICVPLCARMSVLFMCAYKSSTSEAKHGLCFGYRSGFGSITPATVAPDVLIRGLADHRFEVVVEGGENRVDVAFLVAAGGVLDQRGGDDLELHRPGAAARGEA